MNTQLAIGVDLGATKIATALTTRDGKVLASRQTATLASDGADAVLERIAGECRALMAESSGHVVGVGIGSAGLVDSVSGVVRLALNLGWDVVPLAPDVSRRLGSIPVFADNDANANALGEGYFGSAIGCRRFVLLTVGSGLGSGLVHEGRLVNGTMSMVSNLGHYSLDPERGLPCGCGHRGCAETLVGGPALVAAVRRLLSDPSHPSTLRDDENLTTDRILAAARAGDEVASSAIATVARALGEVASIAAAVLGPQVIVIGGGLGVAAANLLLPGVERELSGRLPPPQEIPPLRIATLASPALGAATLVWDRLA